MNHGPIAARALPGSNRPKWRKTIERFRSHLLQYQYQLRSRNSSRPGVAAATGEREIIVSLTTTAERLATAHLTIETLLRQSFRPHRIVLWLDENLAGSALPEPLLRQQTRGLEIRFRHDLRSFTKLVHALREHPGSVIVTADDDVFYPRGWLGQLHDSYERFPKFIHCQRAHRMRELPDRTMAPYFDWDLLARGCVEPSSWLFPTGVSGVLYPPGSLNAAVFDDATYLRLCPAADDVWFKAMSLLSGVPAVKASASHGNYPTVPGTQRNSLVSSNWTASHYDRQIQAVFSHYDLLPLSEKVALF